MAAFDLVPIEETPEELFRRTGAPQEDPSVSAPFELAPDQPDIAPYDWTVAGMPLPKGLQPVGDIIAGMNQGLANVAGLPIDAVDALMRQIGMDGVLDQPGTGRDAVVRAMEKLNIGADKRKAANQFLADLGEASGENLVLLSAFFAAAPTMMTAKGEGFAANFMRDLGKALIKHPWMSGISEVGAAVGGETGAMAGEAVGGELGETLGGIAGALGGGATPLALATGGLSQLAKGGTLGLIGAARRGAAEVGELVNIGRRAIGTRPLVTELSPPVDLIGGAIKADQLRVEGIIERLAAKMTQSADPLESAEQLQTVLRKAYPYARRFEDEYWKKADVKKSMSTAGIKAFRDNMIGSTVKEGRDEWLPNDLLADIKRLPKNAPIERLRAIRTKAFQRLQSGTVPTPQGVLAMNDTLRGNLNTLIKEIDTQIETAFPNDVPLKQAIEYTRWIHSRFTRGPVSQFARPRSGEEQLPDIEAAARGALRQKKFGPQVADIAERLDMPALTVAAEQFLRGQLEAEIARLGPQAAAKFVKMPSTKAFVRSYPRIAAEWASTGKRLDNMMSYRKEIMDSAFLKMAGEQPQTAINRIITSSNKVRHAKLLHDRVKGDPDALEAAKNQMILEVERIAGSNPSKVLQILDGTDVRPAMRQILGNDLDRLERIARESVEWMKAEKGVPRYMLTRGSRVIGAWVGRRLNTRTLQAPEFGGRLAQRIVEDWIGKVENDIFSRAVRYPAWEAVLKARMPQSNTELHRLRGLVRRAIRIEEASERASLPLQGLMVGEEEQ